MNEDNLNSIAGMTETEARAMLEKLRWANGIICPKCGVVGNAHKMVSKAGTKNPVRDGVYKCRDCRKQFTVTVGTIFEDSHIPLHKWLAAIYLMNASKKGISAHQLHRMLDITYKAAWFMAHRIRYAMSERPLGKLLGIIEADETYVGGRESNKHAKKKIKEGGKRGTVGKTAVFALVQRNGDLRAGTMSPVTSANIREVMREHVTPNSHIMTDQADKYVHLDEDFLHHELVNHSKKEYVRGDVHVNTLEGWFSLLKRGINGTFHHVSPQHLDRYVGEFEYRYNNRKLSDGERAKKAIKQVAGKRLVYKDTIKKKPAN